MVSPNSTTSSLAVERARTNGWAGSTMDRHGGTVFIGEAKEYASPPFEQTHKAVELDYVA